MISNKDKNKILLMIQYDLKVGWKIYIFKKYIDVVKELKPNLGFFFDVLFKMNSNESLSKLYCITWRTLVLIRTIKEEWHHNSKMNMVGIKWSCRWKDLTFLARRFSTYDVIVYTLFKKLSIFCPLFFCGLSICWFFLHCMWNTWWLRTTMQF